MQCNDVGSGTEKRLIFEIVTYYLISEGDKGKERGKIIARLLLC